MNISTGIAEINLRRTGENSPVSGKNYIWPRYHDGKIEKINASGPQNQEPAYFKPSIVEREKLLSAMSTAENEYNSYGRTDSRKTFIQPGSFFDALA